MFVKGLAPSYDEAAAKKGKVKTIATAFKNNLNELIEALAQVL